MRIDTTYSIPRVLPVPKCRDRKTNTDTFAKMFENEKKSKRK